MSRPALASPSVESKENQYWREKGGEDRNRDSGLSHTQSNILPIPSSVLAARSLSERHDLPLPSPATISIGSPRLHYSYASSSASSSANSASVRSDIHRFPNGNGNDAHRRHTVQELPPLAAPPLPQPHRSQSLQTITQNSRHHHEHTLHNSISRAPVHPQSSSTNHIRHSRPASREEGAMLSPISPSSRSHPPQPPLSLSAGSVRDWSPPPPSRRSSGSYANSPHPTGSGATPQSPIVVELDRKGSGDIQKHTHSRPGSSGSANQVSLAPHLLGQHTNPQPQQHRVDGVAALTAPQVHPTASPRGLNTLSPATPGNSSARVHTYSQPPPSSSHVLSPIVMSGGTVSRQPLPVTVSAPTGQHPHPRETVHAPVHNRDIHPHAVHSQQRRQTYPQSQTSSPSSSIRVPAHSTQHPYSSQNQSQTRIGSLGRYTTSTAPIPVDLSHAQGGASTASSSLLTYLQNTLAHTWSQAETSWQVEVDDLRRTVYELNTILRERDEEIIRLRTNTSHPAPSVNDGRLAAIEERLAKSEKECMKNESEKTHLKGELISLRSDKDDLLEEIEELQSELSALRASSAKTAPGGDEDTKRLKDEVAILNRQLDSWKGEANRLGVELDRRERESKREQDALKSTQNGGSRPNAGALKDGERSYTGQAFDSQHSYRTHNNGLPIPRHTHSQPSMQASTSSQSPTHNVRAPVPKIDTNIAERDRAVVVSPQEASVSQRSQNGYIHGSASTGIEVRRPEHSLAQLPPPQSKHLTTSPNHGRPISLPPIMGSLPSSEPDARRPHLPSIQSQVKPVEARPPSSLSHRQSSAGSPSENVNGIMRPSRLSPGSESVNGRKREREEDGEIVDEHHSNGEVHGGKVMKRGDSEDVAASREREKEREVNSSRTSDSHIVPPPNSSSSWSSSSTLTPGPSPPSSRKPMPPPGPYPGHPKPGIMLTSKPLTPVPPPAPPPKREEKPRQLSFKHLNLLYETSGDHYVCRECRLSPSGQKPKTFPHTTPLPEIFKHSLSEHETRCEELLKASASKLAEEGVLMRGGGGSTLGTGSKAPRRERK
ncbi:hypothetical protein Moror_170 [Moniliophthora roreri MCA 2997]|uniref:Uncharacterized protein n=2 Tax=Moniliophthora roreri TaxID=221103 RepID=V2Y0Y2_MONRO|nr:hypothetical protein Moror_170 [Moniliophthora roreri MCA 2997]KAI3622532.1 hypothetical protein WG66_015539 [Moniliophthora roreri]